MPGDVNILFAADLFNEGLDIPDTDTILLLRPTESATIFLQQLGRGLRRTRDKAVLTVLDFVGYHRKEFRFDLKLRAITGDTRAGIERQVREGFPFLPSGCSIQMDRQAQTLILENIRSQIANRWQQIVAELRRHSEADLGGFLEESGIELSDILRRGSHSWTRLRRDAGLPTATGSEREAALLKRVRAFAHVDDRDRAMAYARLLDDDAPGYDELSDTEQRLARMLFNSLWSDGGGFSGVAEGFAALQREEATRREISAVVDLSFDAARHVTIDLEGLLRQIPLKVHARYQREEILGALNFPRNPNSFREGVWYSDGSQRRCLLRHAQEVRDGLLAHHDVSRLPHLPHAFPLGVAIHHVSGFQDRPALSEWIEQRADLRATRAEGRVRHVPLPLPRARPLPRRTRGIAPSLSRGSLEHALPIDFFATASAVAQ